MEQRQRGGRSDGWEGVGAERSNGWPLGLQPGNTAARRSTSTFLVSTPSLTTSSSSSDFDTESTGSFFPEKSTTLGSLIGIHTSSQLFFIEGENSSTEGSTTRRKSTRRNNRSRTYWSLLGCGGVSPDDSLDVSPSLAHFLGEERRDALSQRQTAGTGVEHNRAGQEQGEDQRPEEYEEEQEEDERFHLDEVASHKSGLFDNAGMTTSRPCGPSLKFMLHQPSPTSYLSTDWNVYSDLSQNRQIRGDSSDGHGRFHTLWPGLCCRLSTSVAN